jgi:hypothetical protein
MSTGWGQAVALMINTPEISDLTGMTFDVSERNGYGGRTKNNCDVVYQTGSGAPPDSDVNNCLPYADENDWLDKTVDPGGETGVDAPVDLMDGVPELMGWWGHRITGGEALASKQAWFRDICEEDELISFTNEQIQGPPDQWFEKTYTFGVPQVTKGEQVLVAHNLVTNEDTGKTIDFVICPDKCLREATARFETDIDPIRDEYHKQFVQNLFKKPVRPEPSS